SITRVSLHPPLHRLLLFFFFHHPPPTEIYTLSLHDALPIWHQLHRHHEGRRACRRSGRTLHVGRDARQADGHRRGSLGRLEACRSEEHTSELQSLTNLVCRLLLEKKKTMRATPSPLRSRAACAASMRRRSVEVQKTHRRRGW